MKNTKLKSKTARKPAKTASTALARRSAAAPARRGKVTVLPAAPDPERNLGDEIMLGGLGLADIKLKPEEELVLAEPVNVNDVSVKPTGQPYLSHPVYTRWFGRAFGRLGWALVPVSKPTPTRSGNKTSVVVPYVLYIHGQPAAFAQGEQEYFENNAEQTYGDALESTVASALRRCAKRLGVGLELWDKRWLEVFKEARCIRVKCEVWEKGKKTNRTTKLWRLKDAPPFWNEVRGGSRRRDEEEQDGDAGDDRAGSAWSGTNWPNEKKGGKGVPPADSRAMHAGEGEKITLAQRQRLAMIVNSSDRSDVEVAEWLGRRYGLTNDKPTRDILVRDYDDICKAIEAPGRLPEGGR